jgi:flagellar biosynthetic protein FliO
LADSPVRKRPVAASRTAAPKPQAARIRRPAAAPILEDEAPSANYALRLTEALEAISSAESGRPLKPRDALPAAPTPASAESDSRPRGASFAGSLKALDALPPIRLPIGPAIPWRLGLPLLAATVAVVAFMSRPSAHADAQGVRLPVQETYAVQQEAPLFTNASQAQAPVPTTPPAAAAPALGVQDPGGLGFDAADIAFKLIAVLALAYGSLYLLKRFSVGGSAASKTGATPGMRVVSSLALAPNRSVHVLKVPGGKTLLVGATPNQVNLIADLGDAASDEESPEATSFFDVLKGKINN